MIAVEYDEQEVFLTLDDEGLALLIEQLTWLQTQAPPEHLHLMTPSWAGDALSEEQQLERSTLAHHLRVQFFR